MNKPPRSEAILLFDGVCNLCHGAVRFIIPRDPSGRIRFASLQSETGRRLLARHGFPADELRTVVLIEGDSLYTRSDAMLRVGRKLNGWWPLLSSLGLVIPRPVRDCVYDWIARNRYRWFGRQEQCLLPTPEIRQRFVE
ncbi:thiol-disulfide oxidoreductase DCC family protein [Brevibacillus thermoruber]|jgi:predicted DCC family thiol-disulfide oxidoreductase YuxK|uniref:thiol-disulfide oxidoreductase DCC family protein n=1 Tax=Brevibacillus thermoruber TaxID=33942 RepID=UPI0040424D8D